MAALRGDDDTNPGRGRPRAKRRHFVPLHAREHILRHGKHHPEPRSSKPDQVAVQGKLVGLIRAYH